MKKTVIFALIAVGFAAISYSKELQPINDNSFASDLGKIQATMGEEVSAAELGEAVPPPEARRVLAESSGLTGRPLVPGATRRVAGIGLSHSGDPLDIPNFSPDEIASLLKEAGGTHYRPHLPLKEPLPLISAAQIKQLRQAKDDPALMDAMIEDLSRNGRWERMDALVNAFTQKGIRLILVVGCGYHKEMPRVEMPNGSKRTISPSGIGRNLYIAFVRWFTGAAVRRYASQVEFWQVENEITIAWVVSLPIHRWRLPDLAWADGNYQIRLLAALSETVHSEGARQGRDLKTMHNFLTTSVGFGHNVKTYSTKANLDIIGIDLYGNYIMGCSGWPMLHKLMVADVRKAVRLAGGKPVWVLEAGYSRGPKIRGFSEANQAKYFRELFDGSYRAGADLVLAFGWFWNPRGWYTSGWPPPPWWHPIMAAEPYWSPLKVRLRPDGSKEIHFGPAWNEFKKAARKWTGPR